MLLKISILVFYNGLGQVCIPYALLWVLLMPLAIWLEDTAMYVIWRYYNSKWQPYDQPGIPEYSLNSIYFELFIGK